MTLRDVVAGDDAVHARRAPRAALTSMRLMRPCATVLRKILPYSMPGRRRLCTYSARPVTLARAFEARHRAADLPRPIVVVAISASSAACERLAHRARRRRRAGARACRRPSRARRLTISASSAAASPARAQHRVVGRARRAATASAPASRVALLGRGADHDAGVADRVVRRRRARPRRRAPASRRPTRVVHLEIGRARARPAPAPRTSAISSLRASTVS